MAHAKESKWKRQLVNFNQTPEERQVKYRLALGLGANSALARRMRDWRESKIKRAYGLI